MVKNVLIMLLLLITVTAGAVSIYKTHKYKEKETPINTMPNTPDNNKDSTLPKQIDKLAPSNATLSDFQNLLLNNCNRDSKISIALLPFKFPPEIYSEYVIKDTIDCYPGFEQGSDYTGAGRMYVEAQLKDAVNSRHTLIFGDSFSKSWGMEDNLSTVHNNKHDLVKGDAFIVINIHSPGPYGLSSRILSFDVSAYKFIENCFVMASEFHAENVSGDILELFEKYADIRPNITEKEIEEGAPRYTVHDRYDEFRAEFIQKYFVNYPNISPDYKTYVDNVLDDVESITSK